MNGGIECVCCRKCGATVPCEEAIFGDDCAGRCFCGVPESDDAYDSQDDDDMTKNRQLSIPQVHALLSDDPAEARIEMPPHLGSWRKHGFKPRVPMWIFVRSPQGQALADHLREISDAANNVLAKYLAQPDEFISHCFRGAWRDGFASGVAWQRERSRSEPGDLDKPEILRGDS